MYAASCRYAILAGALLSVLPVHHVFEIVMGLLVPLSSGGTISYVYGDQAGELLWMMRSTRPTMMVVVPRLLELLYNGVSQKVASGGPLLKGYFRASLALSVLTGGRYGPVLSVRCTRSSVEICDESWRADRRSSRAWGRLISRLALRSPRATG